MCYWEGVDGGRCSEETFVTGSPPDPMYVPIHGLNWQTGFDWLEVFEQLPSPSMRAKEKTLPSPSKSEWMLFKNGRPSSTYLLSGGRLARVELLSGWSPSEAEESEAGDESSSETTISFEEFIPETGELGLMDNSAGESGAEFNSGSESDNI